MIVSRPEISLQPGDLFMDTVGNKRKKRTQRDYTMGFKLQVVASVEKGDMTYKQAQKSKDWTGPFVRSSDYK
jgi:hypothetical protein